MTTPPNRPADPPGIALQTLLRSAKTPALRALLGPSVVDTLRALDPHLASPEGLADLAARLIDPSAALRDPHTRPRILRLLPLFKARELARRLRAKDGRTLYDDLCKKAADPAALEDLVLLFWRGPRSACSP